MTELRPYGSPRHRKSSAVRQSEFLVLLTARLTSVAGAGVYFIAGAWLLIADGGGSSELAGLGVAMVVPGLLFALQGGVLIDRYSRRRVGQFAELTKAAAVVVLAVIESGGLLSRWELYGVTAVLGLGTAVTLPCYGAMLPQVLPSERLVRGNAIWQIATQVGAISASALGGVLVGRGGTAAGLWVTAACYILAAASLQLVPVSSALPEQREARFLRNMAVAIRVAGAHPVHRYVTVFSILPLSFLAAANVVLPIFCKQQLAVGSVGFGLVEAVWGVGAILGGFVISRWSKRIRQELRLLVRVLLFSGVAMAVFAVIPQLGLSLVAALLLGFALSCSNVLFPAYVQANVPEYVLGRVLSAVQFASSAVQLVFCALVWAATDSVPSWMVFFAMGLTLIVCAQLLRVLLSRRSHPESMDSFPFPVEIESVPND